MNDRGQQQLDLAGLRSWVDEFRRNVSSRAVVLLRGPLGAGKTQWVRELVAALGGAPVAVSSPTFALYNRYETKPVAVDHLDLYRVESADDLESIGFWDLFLQEEGLIAVEWAERLGADALPPSWQQWELTLEFAPGQGRPQDQRILSWRRR